MDTNVIKMAQDKQYSDFGSAIKAELKSRLVDNPVIQNYMAEVDRYDVLKSAFSDINSLGR